MRTELTLLFAAAAVVVAEYNLIYMDPTCHSHGICPQLQPNTLSSIYPNAEERTQMTFINTARLFPQQFVKSKYGRHKFGVHGTQTVFHDDGNFCGKASETPMWLWPDANEAARFHALSSSECQHRPGNRTCPVDCHIFNNNCEMRTRVEAFEFNQTDNARIVWEALCGANRCYTNDNCDPIFDPERRYMAVGFAGNGKSNVVDHLYLNDGPEIEFPVPIATHFDERIKVNVRERNQRGKHLVFQAIYYHKTRHVIAAFVLYKGQRHNMTRVFGTSKRALYEFRTEIPNECEPYYFEFVTAWNTIVRVPESEDYYFGTIWTPFRYWNAEMSRFPPNCLENHYYRRNGVIEANGGPSRQGTSGGYCVGCSKVAAFLQTGIFQHA